MLRKNTGCFVLNNDDFAHFFFFTYIQAGAVIMSMKFAGFLHFFFPSYSWRKIVGEMDKCDVYSSGFLKRNFDPNINSSLAKSF